MYTNTTSFFKMTKQKQQQFRPVRLYNKDHQFLMMLKKKWKVTGIDVVIERLIKAVKKHLCEEDLK